MPDIARLRTFVHDFTQLIDQPPADEEPLLAAASALLSDLLAVDDWLPSAFSRTDPVHYRQYLLHCDALRRFSVVSFVWGPGQSTPIHNHTVWGLIGILRGAETNTRYVPDGDTGLAPVATERFEPGQIARVSPRLGDIHQVGNARADGDSVSIHVYGANIGAVRRSSFSESGEARSFVSGYSSDVVPNLWDRSA